MDITKTADKMATRFERDMMKSTCDVLDENTPSVVVYSGKCYVSEAGKGSSWIKTDPDSRSNVYHVTVKLPRDAQDSSGQPLVIKEGYRIRITSLPSGNAPELLTHLLDVKTTNHASQWQFCHNVKAEISAVFA
jgi:hypothetical protein